MISVVIPAYNESEGLRALYERLTACAATWNEDYEIILIDDGSRDDTLAIAVELAERDKRWVVLSLTRNFGHQSAATCGLMHARGDLIAVLDADLQDPPEELPRFFAKCREGFDVVYGVRTKRKEGIFKRTAYFVFYRLLASLASIEIPLDSGDFCVMTRRAVDALNSLPERSRFIRGLRSWVGFKQTGLVYERQARHAGEPKYTFRKLINLAMDGIINFSAKPLRLIAIFGLLLGVFSVLLAGFVFMQHVFDWTIWGYRPKDSKGWTSTILAILFLASAQLFCLGVIGEYLGRIFDEIKGRPVYLIGRRVNSDTKAASDPGEKDSAMASERLAK